MIYYTNFRGDIITPGKQLYKFKQEYDSQTIAKR